MGGRTGAAAWALIACAVAWVGETATAEPADPDYAALAREVMADMRDHFWLAEKGLYARVRGGREPDFMWGCGVAFSALAGGVRHDPAAWRATMGRFFEALDGYWDSKCPIPGYEPAPTAGNGNDKYYDDNAWMVLTFAEAYGLTGERRYLERARETLHFVLSGWDETLGGGIWWHERHKDGSKNTCANAPAAVGCIMLARFAATPDERNERLRTALRIVEWTDRTLQAPDGLYHDNIRAETRRVNHAKLTYNAALMLRAKLGLHRASGDRKFLDQAVRTGKAADGLTHQGSGVYRDEIKWAHLMVEADLELHRATGDAGMLERARRNAEEWHRRWRERPPDDLITVASIARALWLVADVESAAGREFWRKMDGPVRAARGR